MDNGAAPAATSGSKGRQTQSRIIDTELRSEAENSYIAYAMSVIVGRALPDVRDGLKPVHRRILFAMHDLSLVHTKPYRKCARVVGEVLGKYHPHGDTAVYDALVRLAQNFSMRAPLIAGHGNFGSLDNDPPAAMRYTECRLQAFSSSVFLSDLAFDTVSSLPTFDGAQEEPTVLPSRLPHLLINGGSGIAVGIATKIPPHNMGEVVAGLKALINDPNISIDGLMKHIPAPDFPTGGEIVAAESVKQVFETGRGPITLRGRAYIEENGQERRTGAKKGGKASKGSAGGSSKPVIVITELPYQTNKAGFVADVAELVEKGTLTGISDVRDESDREGMRVVIEPKRGNSPDVILNALYQHTALQSRFSANVVAIVNGQPETLSLKQCLQHFLDFRRDVVERRARHHLSKAQARLHIVDGLLIAQASLDAVVADIRRAADGSAASKILQEKYKLDTDQADAVLAMTLRRLTSMETSKLQQEQQQLNERIAELQRLLADPRAVLQVVSDEASELADKFGDKRRTLVRRDVDGQLATEDIIPNAQSLIVFSARGFIKRMPADTFSVQNRGGTGKMGTRLRDDDSVEDVLHVNDHDHLLFFTTDGIVRSLRAHVVPYGSRTSAGTSISQVLQLKKGDSIAALLPVSEFAENDYLLMLTRKGSLKKQALAQFKDVRSNGVKTIGLQDGDELTWVGKCTAACSVLIAASDGNVLHVSTSNESIKPQRKGGRGLLAMRLKKDAKLVAMSVLPAEVTALASSQEDSFDEVEDDDSSSDDSVPPSPQQAQLALEPRAVLITKQGYGKQVPVRHFRLMPRKGRGVIGMRMSEGDSLAALCMMEGGDVGRQGELLTGTGNGIMSRTPLSSMPIQTRLARGVRVIRLAEDDSIASVTVIPPMEDSTQA